MGDKKKEIKDHLFISHYNTWQEIKNGPFSVIKERWENFTEDDLMYICGQEYIDYEDWLEELERKELRQKLDYIEEWKCDQLTVCLYIQETYYTLVDFLRKRQGYTMEPNIDHNFVWKHIYQFVHEKLPKHYFTNPYGIKEQTWDSEQAFKYLIYAFDYIRFVQKFPFNKYAHIIPITRFVSSQLLSEFKHRNLEQSNFKLSKTVDWLGITYKDITIESIYSFDLKEIEQQYLDRSILNPAYEAIKEHFMGQSILLSKCEEHTNLYDSHSGFCQGCPKKKECCQLLKKYYPKLYEKKGYQQQDEGQIIVQQRRIERRAERVKEDRNVIKDQVEQHNKFKSIKHNQQIKRKRR